MKFIVEISDFWIDEGDLRQALKDEIQRDIVLQISKGVRDDAKNEIKIKVEEIIKDKVSETIDSVLLELVEKETILVNKEEVTISQHLKNIFTKNHGWSNPSSAMKQIAEQFGDSLKVQYNNIFANKIVQNMKEQGFLKDDIAQLLLEGNDKKSLERKP